MADELLPATTKIRVANRARIPGYETRTPSWLRVRSLGPWGSSALVHGILLLLLVLLKLPFLETGSLIITAFTGIDSGDDQEIAFLTESLSDSYVHELELPSTSEVVSLDAPDDPFELVEPELEPFEIALDEPVATASATTDAAEVKLVEGQAKGRIGAAGSVEEAVDQITGGIEGRLAEGDVLVVWLLDASLSLKEDRQRIAQRLDRFFAAAEDASAKSANSKERRLVNAVATFGRGFREVVSPTENSQVILRAIKNTPVDKSGHEKVFLAVQKCIGRYRKKWRSQMMVVVWTDESGDDAVRLDRTIGRAQQADVTVSVVGRSAVLGDERALHDWVDPKTRAHRLLPIRNGPDCAAPERLRLDYWFRGNSSWSLSANRRHPAWYGNDQLLGLSSSFSPWALTRLAVATGGSFTIFDADQERAPYDQQKMVGYRPAYVSRRAYEQQLRENPLRQAIRRVVELTRREEMTTPGLTFFGVQSADGRIQPLYFMPSVFRSQLRVASRKTLLGIKRYQYHLEKALALLSDPERPEQGLEDLYRQETSPRWKAWYELTRGRLLAASVRAEEYRLALESLSQRDALRESTNGLVAESSNRLQSSEKFQQRASEAETLLRRCVQNHADTPWAYLANRELTHGLGIQLRQMVYAPTGQLTKQSGSKTPKF